ncbi:MAG: hypothetical protein ABI317_14535 [Gaiellales bacterium]
MEHAKFTSRSTGVIFWAVGYLATAIAGGVLLAAFWPQGSACSRTCGERIEAGAVAIGLLALGGLVGLVAAIWLGVRRRPTAPKLLVVALVAIIVASTMTGLTLMESGSGDTGGLETVRSAWSWAFTVPAAALLVTALAARIRLRVATRRARPSLSARARRA